jgi:cell division septum initiation protein DivIVA
MALALATLAPAVTSQTRKEPKGASPDLETALRNLRGLPTVQRLGQSIMPSIDRVEAAARAELAQAQAAATQASQERDIARRQAEEARATAAKARTEADRLASDAREKDRQSRDLRTQISELKRENDRLRQDIANKGIESGRVSAERDRLQSELTSKAGEIEQLTRDRDELRTSNSQKDREIATLRRDTTELQGRVTERDMTIARLQDVINHPPWPWKWLLPTALIALALGGFVGWTTGSKSKANSSAVPRVLKVKAALRTGGAPSLSCDPRSPLLRVATCLHGHGPAELTTGEVS